MLALIAGQGDLPTRVASRLTKWPVIASLEQFPPDELIPEITFRLETLGTLLRKLADRGVHQVCFSGAIRRPSVEMSAVDVATAPLVPRLMAALGKGDDGALRIVIEIFQDAGFTVLGVDELVPDFLPPVGCLTRAEPSKSNERDLIRAMEITKTLAPRDVGQGCVVASGQVLAIETLGGTDWMLRSLSEHRQPDWPEGGVLFKAPKSGQDRRIDLPTIGHKTVQLAADLGLDGIVVAYQGVMVLDPDRVVETANKLGVFVMIHADTL